MNRSSIFGFVCCVACGALILGCATYDEGEFVMVRARFGNWSTRYRVCPWPEISDWLVSGKSYVRNDGDYECFLNKAEESDICVEFSPVFEDVPGEVMTVYCENSNEDAVLPVKGFPSYCKGIHLEGHFDLSNVRIGDGVECFYLQDCLDDCIDGNLMIPDFSNADNLRYLELSLLKDEYKAPTQIPVLDATRFSGLAQLTNLSLRVDFPIVNVEKLSACKSLRRICLETYFSVAEGGGNDETEDDEEFFGTTVESKVDDSSFDEFIKRDFSDVERLEVKIDLKKTRTWDISSLANKRLDLISINAKNCWVTGMESFRRSKGLTWFGVTMEFESPEESEL